MQPVLTQNAAAPALRGDPGANRRRREAGRRPVEPVLPAASAAESAAVRGGAFIAPRPVDPGPARPTPVAQPAVPPVGGAARDATPRQGRVPSLIERVTGMARSRPAAPPAPPRAAAPSAPAGNAAAPAAAAAGAARRAAPGAGQNEQGGRSARHPGFPAPPGELTENRSDRGVMRRQPNYRRSRFRPEKNGGRPSQCDTAAAACSSTSAPVVKRSSANGAASGCGSSRAIVCAKTQPAPGVALNPPVPQPPFR